MASSVTLFLGKLFIITSLIFQAFLLYQDKNQVSTFDKNLKNAMAGCDCLTPQIQQLIKQHLRLAVVGLLASSLLLLFLKHWTLKINTLIGLFVLLWVEQHLVFRSIPTISILQNTALFHSLGVIGAIIYLMGAQCTSCEKKELKESKKPQPVAANDKPQPVAANDKPRTSNDKKRN